MKRRELGNALRNLGWRFLRHGTNHDVWTDGERQEAIPHHAEINEKLARAIVRRVRSKELTMRFQGQVYKDGKFWLAEVPIFAAMTQGRTRKEALAMIVDWFATMVNRPDFSVAVHEGKKGSFELSSPDIRAMVCLLLQRQRQLSGLSLAAAAERLGAKSCNAYALYEQGTSVPTVEKLDELLQAVSLERGFVLLPSPLIARSEKDRFHHEASAVGGKPRKSLFITLD
ncbi:MAG: helix-turn-helix transcriptional regulator [Deltaproteobacteria bacterium]|nr:helix-turn-helix transcriptional regulator [Deltaproteobacteria bacterium]